MSAQELDRLTVIERVLEKRLSQVEASKQLGVTPRQMRRLIGRYRQDGAAGLESERKVEMLRRSRPLRIAARAFYSPCRLCCEN